MHRQMQITTMTIGVRRPGDPTVGGPICGCFVQLPAISHYQCCVAQDSYATSLSANHRRSSLPGPPWSLPPIIHPLVYPYLEHQRRRWPRNTGCFEARSVSRPAAFHRVRKREEVAPQRESWHADIAGDLHAQTRARHDAATRIGNRVIAPDTHFGLLLCFAMDASEY